MIQDRFDFEGQEPLRERITAALHRVIDPEAALDIVELGLVYGVRAAPGVVEVRMTMTSAACPVGEFITDEVAYELRQELGGDTDVSVQLVWDPPWTPERLSDRAKTALAWD